MRNLIGSLIAFLAFTSFGYAQTAPKTAPETAPKAATPTTPKRVTLTDEEAQVLSRLHATNRKEIVAGALAKDRCRSEEARRYGQRLMDDHAAADRKLKALAKRKNVTLTDSNSSQINELQAMSAPKFESVFVSTVLRDHNEAIKLVKDAQGRAKDPDVLLFLNELLPTLEKHRDMAERLYERDKS